VNSAGDLLFIDVLWTDSDKKRSAIDCPTLLLLQCNAPGLSVKFLEVGDRM
jgi:hypothetical protein